MFQLDGGVDELSSLVTETLSHLRVIGPKHPIKEHIQASGGARSEKSTKIELSYVYILKTNLLKGR